MAFTEITGPEFFEIYLKRLQSETEELTWLRQFREILSNSLKPGMTMLDVGCGVGYAYKSFREFEITYIGLDFEPEFIAVAKEYFKGCADAGFFVHDISKSTPSQAADIVICSATLEHIPKLFPALEHIVAGAKKTLLLRTFLGNEDDIHSIPSPVINYKDSHVKYTNQYAFKDVLGYIQSQGFKTRVYRDKYTDSIPQYVDQAVRTFYVVHAEKDI